MALHEEEKPGTKIIVQFTATVDKYSDDKNMLRIDRINGDKMWVYPQDCTVFDPNKNYIVYNADIHFIRLRNDYE